MAKQSLVRFEQGVKVLTRRLTANRRSLITTTPSHIRNRRADTRGVVITCVSSTVIVRHDDGSLAVYHENELWAQSEARPSPKTTAKTTPMRA